MPLKQKQIDLLKSELDNIRELSDKGLATQPRVLGLQRNLAELEGEKLRIKSDRMRAQQEVSRTEILLRIEYQNKRDNDITVELQTTETRLQQIAQELTVNQRLLAETKSQAVASPLHLVSTEGSPGGESKPLMPKIHYTISRQVRGGVIDIEATENTLLTPGDTVKVDMTMPATSNSDSFAFDALLRSQIPPSPPATATTPTSKRSPAIVPPSAPNQASLGPVDTTGSLQP